MVNLIKKKRHLKCTIFFDVAGLWFLLINSFSWAIVEEFSSSFFSQVSTPLTDDVLGEKIKLSVVQWSKIQNTPSKLTILSTCHVINQVDLNRDIELP